MDVWEQRCVSSGTNSLSALRGRLPATQRRRAGIPVKKAPAGAEAKIALTPEAASLPGTSKPVYGRQLRRRYERDGRDQSPLPRGSATTAPCSSVLPPGKTRATPDHKGRRPHGVLTCINCTPNRRRRLHFALKDQDMPLFIYRCPQTGHRVQGFVAEDVAEDNHVYEPVTCLACRQIHHVNPTTGAVIGEKLEQARTSQPPPRPSS